MTEARIGMVNFINTAPLYETWKQTVARPEWSVTEAPPSKLNAMLLNNELDLGFVSSHEYAANPEQYRILADLSISATGKVGSVFLFSRQPVNKLNDSLVTLSVQSQTSNSLVKIILEDFHGVQPRYSMDQSRLESTDACLAIGDRALRLKEEGTFPEVIDLSEEWMTRTGLPFVFAVWAVRESFWQSARESVQAIHRELLRCVDEGKKNLLAISEQVAPRIPLSSEACAKYLDGIEYDLSKQKQQSLSLYFQHLIRRGEAQEGALPLKIITIS